MLKYKLLIILSIIFLSLLYIGNLNVTANGLQPSQQSPKVLANQQPESALKSEQITVQPQETTNSPPIFTPTNYSNELKKNSKNDAQKRTDGGTEFYIFSGYKFRITDLLLVAFTLALVVCSAILAGIAYRQYSATILSQRAFVFFKRINVVQIPGGRGDVNNLRITADLENSGETGTKYLMNNINWKDFPPGGSPEDLNFSDISHKKLTYAFIGPKATINSPHIDIPITMLEKVGLGQIRLYVWGWVEYNDIFFKKIRHRTEFCHEIAYHKGLVAFIGHSKHNNADDECYRKPSQYVPPT